MNDTTMHIGQANITSAKSKDLSYMINPQQVKHRGMQFMNTRRIFYDPFLGQQIMNDMSMNVRQPVSPTLMLKVQ